MTTFADKNVLITGSASGIGRLMAQKAAVRGANVIMWDLNLAGLESLSDQIEGWGYRAAAYQQCDLSSREEIEENARRVLAEHGLAKDLLVVCVTHFEHYGAPCGRA